MDGYRYLSETNVRRPGHTNMKFRSETKRYVERKTIRNAVLANFLLLDLQKFEK
jgi:hypothetical protein